MIRKNIRFISIVVLFWFAQYIFIPFFSPYLEIEEIAASIAGWIIGAYGLSQLILRIPFGISADRIKSHKLFMLAGLICLSSAGVLLYFARSPVALLTGRFLAGVAASTWVSFTVFFTNYFKKSETGRAVATIMLANNFGTLLSYITGTFLFDQVGIRGLFLISAAAALIGAVLMAGIPEKQASDHQPMVLKDVILTIKNKNLLQVSFLMALVQMILCATALSFTANYAKEIGATNRQLGLMSVFLNSASVIVSFWLSSAAGQKISDRKKLTAALIFLGISCFVVPNCTDIIGLYAAQIFSGLGRSITLSLTMAMALRDILPQSKSTAMGIYQSVYSIGMTVGPIFMGSALDLTGGYKLPFYLAGVFALLSISWGFIVSKQREGLSKPV